LSSDTQSDASSNQSSDESNNESNNESSNQSSDESNNESSNESNNESNNESSNESSNYTSSNDTSDDDTSDSNASSNNSSNNDNRGYHCITLQRRGRVPIFRVFNRYGVRMIYYSPTGTKKYCKISHLCTLQLVFSLDELDMNGVPDPMLNYCAHDIERCWCTRDVGIFTRYGNFFIRRRNI
jgi:hypothetical protein